ncbi:hypothetical protein ACFQ1Q_02885 [Winogradskyella litorisediminis]|uniref:Uncharacterized protein n=1 Tax=Winogradskyella litorisediminis TaxID=1156618 RepID=A0ABW3N397_9FLAO
MRVYNNIEDINKDLQILKLQRDISIEELKMVKQEFKEDFSVANWVPMVLKTLGKLGLYRMAKKIF